MWYFGIWEDSDGIRSSTRLEIGVPLWHARERPFDHPGNPEQFPYRTGSGGSRSFSQFHLLANSFDIETTVLRAIPIHLHSIRSSSLSTSGLIVSTHATHAAIDAASSRHSDSSNPIFSAVASGSTSNAMPSGQFTGSDGTI